MHPAGGNGENAAADEEAAADVHVPPGVLAHGARAREVRAEDVGRDPEPGGSVIRTIVIIYGPNEKLSNL